jgi:hypothetical protein
MARKNTHHVGLDEMNVTFRMVSCWCIAHWSVVNGCSDPLATVIFMGVLSAFCGRA